MPSIFLSFSDRQTPGSAAFFAGSPQLAVFLRRAMDIRNIDLGAAGQAGVLVTHASAGFATAVAAEWVTGAMMGIAALCALHRIPSHVSLSAHFSDSAD